MISQSCGSIRSCFHSIFHLLFIHCRRSSRASSKTFDFLTTRIDTCSFVDGYTTNSDFIKGHILSCTNCNRTTCISYSNVIAINKVHRVATGYGRSTTAIRRYIPSSCCFSQVFDIRVTSRRQVRQVLISCIFSGCHSSSQFSSWCNGYIIATSRCGNQRTSSSLTLNVKFNIPRGQFFSRCGSRGTTKGNRTIDSC